MNGHSNKILYLISALLILFSIGNFAYNILGIENLGSISDNLLYIFENEPETAEAYYTRVIETYDEERLIEDEDFDSLVELADARLYYGDYQLALDVSDAALNIGDSLYVRIIKYHALRELYLYDEAYTLVSDTVWIYEDQEGFLEDYDLVNLYFCYILDGRYQEGFDGYYSIVQTYEGMDSHDAKTQYADEIGLDIVYNNMSWASNLMGDYENGVKYANLSLLLKPDDSITLNNLGDAYTGLYEFDRAIEAYQNALKFDENNVDAYYGLALAYSVVDPDSAELTWEKYLKFEPYDEEAWYQLYLIQEETLEGTFKPKALETLVKLDPSNIDYAKELMKHYLVFTDRLNADILLNEFRDYNGEYMGLILEGYYHLELFDPDSAYDAFSDLLYDYDLSFWDAFYISIALYQYHDRSYFDDYMDEVAYVYGDLNRYELEAEVYYDQEDYEGLYDASMGMIDSDVTYGYGYEMLGDSQYFMGLYDRARQYYEKAERIDGSTHYLLAQLFHTYIYLEDYEMAQNYKEVLIANFPDSNDLKVGIARLAIKDGDRTKAISVLKEVFYNNPYYVWVLFNYPELEPFQEYKNFEVYVDYYYDEIAEE